MQTISEIIEEVKTDICDNYCKCPHEVHEKYLRDMITEEEYESGEYLIQNYCNNCPLNRL